MHHVPGFALVAGGVNFRLRSSWICFERTAFSLVAVDRDDEAEDLLLDIPHGDVRLPQGLMPTCPPPPPVPAPFPFLQAALNRHGPRWTGPGGRL